MDALAALKRTAKCDFTRLQVRCNTMTHSLGAHASDICFDALIQEWGRLAPVSCSFSFSSAYTGRLRLLCLAGGLAAPCKCVCVCPFSCTVRKHFPPFILHGRSVVVNEPVGVMWFSCASASASALAFLSLSLAWHSRLTQRTCQMTRLACRYLRATDRPVDSTHWLWRWVVVVDGGGSGGGCCARHQQQQPQGGSSIKGANYSTAVHC